MSGNRVDSIPAHISQLSSLRQHLCWREHVGDHGQSGARPRLVDTNSFLLPGVVDGRGSGPCLYVAHGSLYVADCPDRGRRVGSSSAVIFGRLAHIGSRKKGTTTVVQYLHITLA